MQNNAAYLEKLNNYVKYTVESGVKPIEVFLSPVCDCYNGNVVAYRANVCVNSMLTGVLTPNDYLNCSADENTLEKFAFRSVKKVLLCQKALQTARIPFKKLFVRCPSSLIYAEDLYTCLKSSLAECGVDEKNNQVCLEFECSVMDAEAEKLCAVFADIRAARFSVAVNGYGGENFAIEKLLGVCSDYLFADKKITELVSNREKRSALAPLVNLAKSLGGEIIACGVENDDELREFRSRDCYGFVPDENYRGALSVKAFNKSAAAVIDDGGDND